MLSKSKHKTFSDKKLLRAEPALKKFLKGSFVHYTPVKDKVPSWDLSTVLDALKVSPFEPIEQIELDLLTLKTVFLTAVCTAKRISELQILDCRPSFCSIGEGGMVLKTNSHFIPKVPLIRNIQQTLEFTPYGGESRDPEDIPRTFCVCRAMKAYLNKTKNIRKSNQIFVTYKQGAQGRPVTTVTIASWLKKVINIAYSLQGKELPRGIKAHGVRAQSCSWADFKYASLLDICQQACWQSSNTFVKHYELDLPRTVSERHGQLVLQASDQ